MSIRILIADDDTEVAEIVALGTRLTWPDCEVFIASSGDAALTLFRTEQPDLAILDINMPAPDGFEVCRQIRLVSVVPILMLRAKNSTVDKIRALDLGADDYLTKPFDHLELLARLRALVRRTGATGRLAVASADHKASPTIRIDSASSVPPMTPAQDLMLGDIRLDMVGRRAYMREKSLQLTSTEYRLLEVLARSAGTVLSHSVLIERVWGTEYAGEEHYVKVFVRRLRQKLDDDADDPRYIQSEWGVGYRFMLPRMGA